MSTLNVSNITDGTTTVGTSYVVNGSAKALLKFTQTTASIEDSLNTSSVTDQAAGNFYQNITNSFATADYYPLGCGDEENNNQYTITMACDFVDSSASQTRWWSIAGGFGASDSISATSIHGDLA